MSVHLHVLPSAADVTARADRFRCERLRAVMGASTCTARQTAERRLNAVRTEILYPICASCPEGAALAARLDGRVAPEVRPAHAPEATPEAARCICAGCSRDAARPHQRVPAELTPLCAYHRAEVRRHERERGVSVEVALGWAMSGQPRPAPQSAKVSAPCAAPGCGGTQGRWTRRTRAEWVSLCARHRCMADERMRSGGCSTAEEALAAVLRRPAPRVARAAPSVTVARQTAEDLAAQDRLAVLRAELRAARAEASRQRESLSQSVRRVGSLTRQIHRVQRGAA